MIILWYYQIIGRCVWVYFAPSLACCSIGLSAYLTVLLKQYEQNRCPHCAWNGLRRIFWQMLHRCFSSSLLARIFLGKPGLLPSSEDGGDGSCAAIIIPERACDLPNAEMKPSSLSALRWRKKKSEKTSAISKHLLFHDFMLGHC